MGCGSREDESLVGVAGDGFSESDIGGFSCIEELGWFRGIMVVVL